MTCVPEQWQLVIWYVFEASLASDVQVVGELAVPFQHEARRLQLLREHLVVLRHRGFFNPKVAAGCPVERRRQVNRIVALAQYFECEVKHDQQPELPLLQVGEHEAKIEAGLLNIKSPIARALIGKDEGDSVEVKTPGGEKAYEILKIEYK